MPNINKIKLSGTSYDIQDANATKTVELTQAQYDALVTGGTVDSNTFYVITDGEMFNPSGKVDTSAFTEFSGAVETELSGKTDESAFTAHTGDSTIHVTTAQTAAWNAKSDFSGSYNDLTDKPTIPTVPTSNTAFTNDAGYITEDAISGKADSSAVTEEISAAVSGKVDTSTFNTYSGSVETALSGKQDTLSAGTNITIVDNVISAEGGGKAVSGGTNISITTGETADTINCTIPAYFHTNTIKGDINIGSNDGVSSDYGRLIIGRRVQSRGNPYFQYSIGIGVQPDNSNKYCQLYGQNSVGIGRGFKIGSDSLYGNGINDAVAIGHNATSRNDGDVTLGASTTASGGSSVAIGSGATADGAEYKMNLNNQIKVTPSNQVYIYNKDNTEMICLQDQLGGGGSSYSAGTNIDITNDIISCTLNASNGAGDYSFKEGWATFAIGRCAHAEGEQTIASGPYSHVEGYFSSASTNYSHAEGYSTIAQNQSEHASGQYNVSNKANNTFGNSGNTLFSVGNGTADNARHNAFEIRQNGDIYLTLNGQDVKLQDQLGGSYVTTDTEQIISGRKIFTYSSSSGKAIEFKQTSDSAKVGFSIKNSASTNNEVASFEFRPNTFTIDGVQHPLMYFGHYRNNNTANAGVPQTVIGFRQYDQKNAAAYHYLMPLPEKAKTPFNLTTSFKDYYAPMGFKNGSTMITADNTGVVDLSSELDGLKLKKLTQAEYDALATKDNSTLYVIVN